MTPQEEAGVKLLAATYERWKAMPPIPVSIGRMEAYALVVACQLSTTYPDAPKSLLEAWETVGRQLMEACCDTPEIYAMLESGWHREYDVPREQLPRAKGEEG